MWNISKSDEYIWKKSSIRFKYTQITRIYFILLRQKSWIEDGSNDQRNCLNTTLSFYIEKKYNEKIDALNRRSNYFEKNETINEVILKQFKNKIAYNYEYLITINRIEHYTFLNRIREITKRDELIKNWFSKQSKEITIWDNILYFEELIFYFFIKCIQSKRLWHCLNLQRRFLS